MSFWGLGMYYWYLTHKNRRSEVSIFMLLNPAAYFHSEYFAPAGIKYRKSAITSFAAMMLFAVLAFTLGALKDAIA